MLGARAGRVDGGCSCPTVGTWIVSPPSIHTTLTALSSPDNHFTAGPNRSVQNSPNWRGGRSRPGVISAAGRHGGYCRKHIVSDYPRHLLTHLGFYAG